MEMFYIPFVKGIRKQMSAAEYEVFSLCYALDQRGNKIFFSNAYLANMLNKTERAVTQILAKLEIAGWIRRIINGVQRIIEIVQSKVNEFITVGESDTHFKKIEEKCKPSMKLTSTVPLKNISTNNIEDNKESNSLDFEIEKYFKSICTYADIDIKLMTTKFMNKYLHSKASIRRNRNNWEGLANNFYISWVSYLKPAENNDVEPQETSEIKKLMKQYGNPKNVVVNGWKYDFNGENICSYDFKGQSRAVRLWDIFKEWIKTPDKWEIIIDGGLIK